MGTVAGPVSATGGPVHALATIADPVGDNGQSFGQAPTDLIKASAEWAVDTLTVTLTYKQVPRSLRFTMVLTDRAANDFENVGACAPNEAVSIRIVGNAAGHASLTQYFIKGALSSEAAVTNATATYVFSHPTLTAFIDRGNDPFTCLSGNADGDQYYGPFDGKTLRITSTNAAAGLRRALASHFKNTYTRAPHQWVACPMSEFIPPTAKSAGFAPCEFEFGRPGGLFYSGGTSMFLADGSAEPVADLNKVTTVYRKRMQPCSIPSVRSGWVNGVVLANRSLANSESLGKGRTCAFLVGSAGMASDIESEVASNPGRPLTHFVVAFHGTNQAGFEAKAIFNCAVSQAAGRWRFDCHNQLADRFVYGFTVSHR